MKGTPIDIYVIPKDVKLTGVIDKNGAIVTIEDNGLYHSTMVSIPDGTGTVTTIKNQKFSNPDIMTIIQEDKPYLLSTDCFGLRFSNDEETKRDRITLIKDRQNDRILCVIYVREYDLDDADIPVITKERCAAAVMMRIDDQHSVMDTPYASLLPLSEKYPYAAIFKEKRKDNGRFIVSRTTTEGCDIYLYDGDNELTHRKGSYVTDEASRKTYITLNDN